MGILIGLVTIALSLSPYPVFYAGVLFLSTLIGYEVSRALGSGFFPLAPLTFLASSPLPELAPLWVLMLSFYAGWKSWSMESLYRSLLVCLYAGLLPLFLLKLRAEETHALLRLLAFVWAVDILSYYVGRSLGRNRLSPRLSPKKTWEGLVGGATAGALTMFLFHGFKGLLWSPLLVAVALMGDLFKSFIKRQAGIKDFSDVLGEHGGFTDRFDSLLFTAPVYLFLLKF